MGAMASQITSLTGVYSTVWLGADQRKHQSSASLAFVGEIHRWPVNSPHKGPVTRKMFPFDDVIVLYIPGNISQVKIRFHQSNFQQSIRLLNSFIRHGSRDLFIFVYLYFGNFEIPCLTNLMLPLSTLHRKGRPLQNKDISLCWKFVINNPNFKIQIA